MVDEVEGNPIHAAPLDWGSDYTKHYNLMTAVRVWACGSNVPLSCGDRDIATPEDEPWRTTKWAGGWDYGFDFSNFVGMIMHLTSGADIPSKYRRYTDSDGDAFDDDQILYFGMLAHGGPGGIDVNCEGNEHLDGGVAQSSHMLNAMTADIYAVWIEQLRAKLIYGATVTLFSCLAAAGTDGQALVVKLSTMLSGKNIKVVAFTTVLYTNSVAQRKSSDTCYPTARVTRFSHNKPAGTNIIRYYEKPEVWEDLEQLPWADSESKYATVAIDGRIVKLGIEGSDY